MRAQWESGRCVHCRHPPKKQTPYPLDHAMYQFGGCHIAFPTIYSCEEGKGAKSK